MYMPFKAMLCIVTFILLTACKGTVFEPYNYSKAEDAKLKTKNYSVKVRGHELKLERKIPFPKPKRRTHPYEG